MSEKIRISGYIEPAQVPGSQYNVVTEEGRPCVYTVPAHPIPTAESTPNFSINKEF